MEIRIKDLINEATKDLENANVADSNIDSWLLAEYVFGINKMQYYLNPNISVSQNKADIYRELVNKRVTKIPLQHITGHQEFMGFDFKVNENVLIPRQDTELLVEQVVDYIGDKDVKVLDMCTGSGCIAISIDKLCKNAKVWAVDLSTEALQVAKENNEINNSNVTFIQSDLFQNVEGKFDIIVSNPPYIKTSEIEGLMEEVKLYDPMIALDGSEDGLKFYKQIIKKSNDYLEKNGIIFFEIGYDQGISVPDILKEYNYTDIKVLKDLSENDRVVIGRYKNV